MRLPALESYYVSKIRRGSHQLANLNVDNPNLSPEPTPTSVTPSGSPTSRTAEQYSASRFVAHSGANVWRSPAFLKRARTSSVSLFDSLYDAFVEESVDKPAKRSKVGKLSGQWRFAENSPCPEDGADSDLPVQPMSEAVEPEAGLEPATEGETGESLSSPVGDLNQAHSNELANPAARAHPTKSERSHSAETEEVRTLVEDESLPTPRGDAVVETIDPRAEITVDRTQDLFSMESSLSGGNKLVNETQSSLMYRANPLLIGNPDGSGLNLISAATQTANPETAFSPLEDNNWEAPVLPSSPLLRPTASPGLMLVSPIMCRFIMDSNVHEEQKSGPSPDPYGGESQSTPDTVGEVSDPGEHATRHNSEGDEVMERTNFRHVSPSRSEQRQVSEGRSLNLDESTTSHQKGLDPSNGSAIPTDFVKDTPDVPNLYARSPLQDMHFEPSSSVGSPSESELGDDDESSMEDYEGFASDGVSSEDPTDLTESVAEQEPLGRASSEEERSREAESDDEERNLLTQHQSHARNDANNKNIEPVSTQDPEIIDPEDNSDDESQIDATSLELQVLEDVGSSPVAVSSPSDPGSRPSDFDLSSSNADFVDEEAASESIAYPALPIEDFERPPTSYFPRPPEYQNTEAEFDAKRGSQLFTPNATQPTPKERSFSIEILSPDYDLPTPQLTQSNSADLLSLEVANPVENKASLRNEPRSLTVPLARDLDDRMSTVPDVISPWFALKRSNQVYDAGEEDDGSGSQSEQSLDSEPQDFSHHVLKPVSGSKPHLQTPELNTVTSIANGHAMVQSPRSAPPLVGLRTRLSYFSPLATIHDHFASTIDVLAIVTSTTSMQRSKSGPKDYHLSLNIIDPSSNSSFTTVQIFRPFKEALPLASKGAAILLRNFKVQSQKHKFVLVSTASSAWAVFEKGQIAEVNGPPVEIGAEERGFAKGLSQWWESLGQDVQGANGVKRGEGDDRSEVSMTHGNNGIT